MYRRKEKYKTSETQKWLSVQSNPFAIWDIHNPSEELISLAVDEDPWTMKHIHNPSGEIQMLAIERDPDVIVHIHNPTQEVLDYLYKNHRTVFDKYFEKVES